MVDSTKETRHWTALALLFMAGLLAGITVARASSPGPLSSLEKVSRQVETLQVEVNQIASMRNVASQDQAAEILKRHLASFSPNERRVLAALVKPRQGYRAGKLGSIPVNMIAP